MNTLEEEEGAAGIAGNVEGGGASQSMGILNRVREWADTFNDVQQFAAAVMDSSDGDNDDLYISLLTSANQAAGAGIRSWKPSDYESHHPYAREFRDEWDRADIDWKKLTKKITYNLHRKVIHGGKGRGGWWNSTLHKFFEKSRTGKAMKRKVDEMMKKVGIDDEPWE